MPRLAHIDPTTDTGAGADLLNGPLKQMQINIFKGLATNAPVLKAFLAFSSGVKGGALTETEHEVVALVASQGTNCDYCLAAHTQIAAGVGIDEEHALNIRRAQGADDREQALIDFTQAVQGTNGYVSDDQLASFKAAGFGDDAVIEVIGALAVMSFTNLYNHVNETEIDFPVAATV